MKIARVSFNGNQEAHYDFLTDLRLKPGDIVVCDITGKMPAIARVAAVVDKSDKATKWIIQKVDMAKFKKKLAAVQEPDIDIFGDAEL